MDGQILWDKFQSWARRFTLRILFIFIVFLFFKFSVIRLPSSVLLKEQVEPSASAFNEINRASTVYNVIDKNMPD